jgi:hypothetical protein
MTDFHDYNTPQKGSTDWHLPLNENFEKLDGDVEIRDTSDNLSDYVPKEGAKFFATDTDAVFVGDGSNWNVATETRHVTSASEMNQALRELSAQGTGGRVNWASGDYTGESFTEPVEIPTDGLPYTLDMRNVHIDVSVGDPYRGEDGYFFYKPPGKGADSNGGDVSSSSINVLGPQKLRIRGNLPTEVDVFLLFDTQSCRIAPEVVSTNARRLMWLRQTADSGHHTFTNGFDGWGGDYCLQLGSLDDPLGKDRSHWYGQIAGWHEAGVYLEKGINNRIWVQPERPNDSANAHNAGVRVLSAQNAIMLHHIRGEHPIDVRANNVGIRTPGTPGNDDGIFFKSRLGVRPSNVTMENYNHSSFDFSNNWLPLLDVGTTSPEASVRYDGANSRAVLNGGNDNGRAHLATAGRIGDMSYHVHAYANVKIGSSGNRYFRVGPYVDDQNYAMLRYDSPNDGMGVEIYSDGDRIIDSSIDDDWDFGRRCGLVFYVRDGYQAFFYNYELVYEAEHDLSGWPENPQFRLDERTRGGVPNASVEVFDIEHGRSKKWENQ